MAANAVPTPPYPFSLQLTASNEVSILKCSGCLNSETSETLRSQVKKLLPEHKNIHLDLADLHFIDSSGLGALLSTYVSAKTAGCELRLVNPSPSVTSLLKLTHLASVLETYGME
ncbi:MAG: STAS domain-containing protein [Acidobacteriia bacterium]|nr:STAS domain-containing protein [Terriglobia bacterium]